MASTASAGARMSAGTPVPVELSRMARAGASSPRPYWIIAMYMAAAAATRGSSREVAISRASMRALSAAG